MKKIRAAAMLISFSLQAMQQPSQRFFPGMVPAIPMHQHYGSQRVFPGMLPANVPFEFMQKARQPVLIDILPQIAQQGLPHTVSLGMVSPHFYPMQNQQFVFPSPVAPIIQGSQVNCTSEREDMISKSLDNLEQRDVDPLFWKGLPSDVIIDSYQEGIQMKDPQTGKNFFKWKTIILRPPTASSHRSSENLQQPVASSKKRKRVSFEPSLSLHSADESSLLAAKALVDLSKRSSAPVSRKNAE